MLILGFLVVLIGLPLLSSLLFILFILIDDDWTPSSSLSLSDTSIVRYNSTSSIPKYCLIAVWARQQETAVVWPFKANCLQINFGDGALGFEDSRASAKTLLSCHIISSLNKPWAQAAFRGWVHTNSGLLYRVECSARPWARFFNRTFLNSVPPKVSLVLLSRVFSSVGPMPDSVVSLF